jgi:septal ring factor EnvC (AmiA/AmiB activator)
MMLRVLIALTVLVIAAPAAAQDVRGMEVCTAEKAMERRTSCLQSNIEFLQQALAKQTREMRDTLNAVDRKIVTQKSEIDSLKLALTKLQQELAELKKGKPEKR